MIFLDKVDPKSGLRKFHVDVVSPGDTANANALLSGVMYSYHVVPVPCRLRKALFSVDADQTASNGVTVQIANVTKSANLILTADGSRLVSASTTYPEAVSGSLDWTANGVIYRSSTNTSLISAGSLVSFQASATAGSANLACTLEYEVDAKWDRRAR
jgi:hypothetical protein